MDDHEDAAELLEEYLRGFGSEIRVAHDGPSALRIAEDFRPELALVDIGMPAMDGYEVARRLRQQTHDPHLRVVAITGYCRDPERERAESAEFDAHLLKPVRAEKLTKVLEDLRDSQSCVSHAHER